MMTTPTTAPSCIDCGLCSSACPTYAVSGRESSSPRGRLAAVRAMDAGALTFGADVQRVLASCAMCGLCSTACPSGVPVLDVLRRARARSPEPRAPRPDAEPTAMKRASEVVLFVGCHDERDQTTATTAGIVRLLAEKASVEVITGCCGADALDRGDAPGARRIAAEQARALVGAAKVLVTSPRCAAMLRHVTDGDRSRPAPMRAGDIEDLPDWVWQRTGKVGLHRDAGRYAIHVPCHATAATRRSTARLVGACGDAVALAGPALCCGSSLSESDPEMAEALRARVLDVAASSGERQIVSDDAHCRAWLRAGGAACASSTEVLARALDRTSTKEGSSCGLERA